MTMPKPKIKINIEQHEMKESGRKLKSPVRLESKEEWEKRLNEPKSSKTTNNYYIIFNDAVTHCIRKDAIDKLFS